MAKIIRLRTYVSQTLLPSEPPPNAPRRGAYWAACCGDEKIIIGKVIHRAFARARTFFWSIRKKFVFLQSLTRVM